MTIPDPPRPTVLEDEIMAETRARKEAYAAEHDFDVAAIARAANEAAQAAGVPLTTREPRRPAPERP